MDKVTFLIAGAFPAEEVIDYAIAKGYQPQVEDGVGEDGTAKSKPNSESPQAFVARHIKEYLVKEVAGITEGKIRADYERQLNGRIAGLYNSVKGNISVTLHDKPETP